MSDKNKQEMTDHDLLIRVDERTQVICRKQDSLKKDFKDHLSKHWQVTVLFISALLMAGTSLVIACIQGCQ